MNKYKVKLEKRQGGKVVHVEEIYECKYPPRVGEGKVLTVDPPIHVIITHVDLIT